jgi:hypothetical protein
MKQHIKNLITRLAIIYRNCLLQLRTTTKHQPLTLPDLLPIALIAHQVQRNIKACKTAQMLQATEHMLDVCITQRYPPAVASKYIIILQWELFFRRIEIESP